MLVLITGGSGSGKSEFAENKAVSLGGNRVYIAAMMPSDAESVRRIERHRAQRAEKGFKTVERYTDIKNLDIGGTALLECVSNLLANEMYSSEGSGENAVSEILEGADALLRRCGNLVAVTNEVASDGVMYDAETERYMKNLGKINRELAARADEVYEVVCAIPNRLK